MPYKREYDFPELALSTRHGREMKRQHQGYRSDQHHDNDEDEHDHDNDDNNHNNNTHHHAPLQHEREAGEEHAFPTARYGLPEAQLLTLTRRALARFGRTVNDRLNSWDNLAAANYEGVFAITVCYFQPYVPVNATARDMHMVRSQYKQKVLEVFVVKCYGLRRPGAIVVELERPACFSFNSGPLADASRFVLLSNNEMEHFINGTTGTMPWEGLRPHWHFARFPIVPSVLLGI